ncbi:MAG TPA: hypothetical protein VFY65_03705, partial [Longimicrobium sp.]|nr:hypothetical protein [Longimicrobium sp.]
MASQDDEVGGGPRPRDEGVREQERALERVYEPQRAGAPPEMVPGQQLTRSTTRQTPRGGEDGGDAS